MVSKQTLGYQILWFHIVSGWRRRLNRPAERRKGFTQDQTAKAMGWSREAVKNYKALNKIDAEAWAVIGTGFQNVVPDDEDEGVPSNGTGVPKSPFSENLLRNILDLAPSQQKQLCDLLAKGKDKKGRKYGKAEFKVSPATSFPLRNLRNEFWLYSIRDSRIASIAGPFHSTGKYSGRMECRL